MAAAGLILVIMLLYVTQTLSKVLVKLFYNIHLSMCIYFKICSVILEWGHRSMPY